MIRTQKMAKNLVLGLGPKYGPPKLVLKNLAPSVVRYHCQLSTNDPILTKFSDAQTEIPTDGRE